MHLERAQCILVVCRHEHHVRRRFRRRRAFALGAEPLADLVPLDVEIRFIPPELARSLAGSLAPYAVRSLPTADSLRKARAEAWVREAERRVDDGSAEDPKEPE